MINGFCKFEFEDVCQIFDESEIKKADEFFPDDYEKFDSNWEIIVPLKNLTIVEFYRNNILQWAISRKYRDLLQKITETKSIKFNIKLDSSLNYSVLEQANFLLL